MKPVTVTFAITDRASAGTPSSPATWMVSVPRAGMAPSTSPTPPGRVSSSRSGSCSTTPESPVSQPLRSTFSPTDVAPWTA